MTTSSSAYAALTVKTNAPWIFENMPESAVVMLVVTMVVGGHDIERQERVKSMSECWERAQATMQEMRTQHSEVKITRIGIGCVIDLGNPI
jgi:hypothetical protein